MDKKDIVIDYHVLKNSEKVNVTEIVKSIYRYIQTHEIYFKYEPSFVEGVLIFGIVGYKEDQEKLQNELGPILNGLGAKLDILLERK